MEQRQAFSQMQTLMNFGDTNDNALGGLVIASAVFTEFFLLRILSLEADKIDAALTENATIEELVQLDEVVAAVLDKVCCIEEQIAKKIKHGVDLRNGNWNGNGRDKDKDKDKDHGRGRGRGRGKDHGYDNGYDNDHGRGHGRGKDKGKDNGYDNGYDKCKGKDNRYDDGYGKA